ncbi:hypothetical protein DIURU_005322 [Diutina rugosa]|uniref:Peroxisomal membrane protein PEX14 n=1 Tax=Diutina rugosa TaxID=5481 RepID=A0A642UKZ0_DIURU|nr:uncharacterized protein DIURU_005322 [Diutina rugosa]KAA8897345.1 hypothetical protein DIURU_005322 [Diutina rugosa]
MNEDLINSAVQFLKDPGVANAPFTKRVEFLESKGLNNQEIEAALQRYNAEQGQSTQVATQQQTNTTANTQAPMPVAQPAPPIDYYGAPPQVPERSWKDYFIMATATAGVTYGLYQVFTKYLLPTIVPPSLESIESDKQNIDEEFAKIDKLLEQLAEDQAAMKEANDTKLKEVDIVIDNVNDFLSKYNKDKLKFDDDMRLMKLEIDNLSNSIEKNMGFTKNNIKDELSDINEELQSLKQLIKTRAEQQSGPARKIAPVSSIPSASEILKKSMANKKATSPTPAAAPSAAETLNNNNSKDDKPATPAAATTEPKRESSPALSKPVTVGNVTAGGIPAWQMQHKTQEELSEKAESPAPEEGSSTAEKPGIPSWQVNATDKEADAKVKDALKNVGVPAWQLNASAGN